MVIKSQVAHGLSTNKEFLTMLNKEEVKDLICNRFWKYREITPKKLLLPYSLALRLARAC